MKFYYRMIGAGCMLGALAILVLSPAGDKFSTGVGLFDVIIMGALMLIGERYLDKSL